jgi:hypothetical protein
VVEGIEGDVIRLSFRHPHAVSRIERLMPSQVPPVVHRPSLATARHSTRGALDGSVFAADGGVTVAAHDTLTVDFAALPAPGIGVTRAWYLEVTAQHEEPERQVPMARAAKASPVSSFQFARVRPNPTTGSTTFEFSLPLESEVRLEVFDLLGRKVATPHAARLGAGRHAIEWDGAGNGAARVSAGLYVCRLEAGAFRAEKKLLIVK